MGSQKTREVLPIVAMILAVPLGGVAVFVPLLHLGFVPVLLGVTALAFVGLLLADLPRVESLALLAVVTIICFVVAPTWRYVIVLSGLVLGHFWGCWLADLLDAPNVERAKRESLRQRP